MIPRSDVDPETIQKQIDATHRAERDKLARLALPSLIRVSADINSVAIARKAYQIADEMIKQSKS